LPIINPQSISPNQGSGYLPGGAGPPAERSNHESLNHRSGVCTGRGRCLCPTTTDIWHPGPRVHRSNAGPVADLRNPESRRRIHVSNAGAATDVCDPKHQWRVHPSSNPAGRRRTCTRNKPLCGGGGYPQAATSTAVIRKRMHASMIGPLQGWTLRNVITGNI
jgi:hypothetical protein